VTDLTIRATAFARLDARRLALGVSICVAQPVCLL
jgi:hypothetical protein